MELLGVVAIIGILSALIAVGVVAYNRSLKVMELNNTAEEIYIAAQNHLTALRTNATAEKALLDTIGYGTQASQRRHQKRPPTLKIRVSGMRSMLLATHRHLQEQQHPEAVSPAVQQASGGAVQWLPEMVLLIRRIMRSYQRIYFRQAPWMAQ